MKNGKYKGQPLYYQRAPIHWQDNHEYVDADKVGNRAVLYYVECDGGDGRCKCPERCITAVCEMQN